LGHGLDHRIDVAELLLRLAEGLELPEGPLAADAAEPVHHLPHLIELANEVVDIGALDAGASGDAIPPGRVEDLGTLALLSGHRLDHRLDARGLAVVDVLVGELRSEPVKLRQDVRGGAHLLDRLEALPEVLEREGGREELLLHLPGFFLVDVLPRLLYQADHVSETQDALGHALGAEL